MGFLILGLIAGFIVDRYLLPMFDMILELTSQCAARKSTSIQIETNLMSLDYQEIAEQGNSLTPTIGFLSEKHDDEDDFYDDDDEEEENKNRMKIGFIK